MAQQEETKQSKEERKRCESSILYRGLGAEVVGGREDLRKGEQDTRIYS